MENYTIVYVLMICLGVLLGFWLLIKSRKKPAPPPQPLPSEPVVSPPPSMHVELAKEIHCIYSYSESEDRAARRVWVCRDCEIENSMLNENCELCGAPKMP